ncbi:MAG: DUF5686 family protein [Dysgonamonadaceae bacterium]|jgi:hypothetical protein|nr:DUF5686 family protein [Dysgonamonadaceae bacterium]
MKKRSPKSLKGDLAIASFSVVLHPSPIQRLGGKKLIFTVLLVWFGILSLQAQIHALVIEKETKLSVPFASITYYSAYTKKVTIADKNGKFTVAEPDIRSIKVTCLSYAPKTVTVPESYTGQLIIELEEEAVALREFVVTPKNNPAHRIIRNAIANKDLNNFEKYDEYSYRCYLKSVFDFSIYSDSIESDSMAYVSETITLCSKQGTRSEEKIIANRTSGLETPIFGQFMYTAFYKAISFYNHSIPVFGENRPDDRMSFEYLTPLSAGSISAYNFQLENEYIQGNDTIYEITYYPRKHTTFNGLQGTLYISSDGYALTSIVAQPYDKQGADFRFKQEYKKIDGKWFPTELEEMIRLGRFPFPIEKGMTMRPTFFLVSNISDVKHKLNQKLPNRLEKMYLDEDSIEKNRLLFDELRPIPMTSRETALYNTTDSLLRAIRKEGVSLDFILNLTTKLHEYKVPIGMIDIDLGRLALDNKYESTRWGLGLYTNEEWLRWLSVGGYFGYGSGDKQWKYGGEIEWIIQKSHELRFKYLYQNTLKELGKPLASNSIEWNENYLRSLMASRFDRVTEHKLEARYQPFRSLQLRLAFSAKNMTPLYDYAYQNQPLTKYAADDVRFSLRYAFKEKYGTIGKQRMLVTAGNPVFNIHYTRGINYLRRESKAYNRIEATIDILAYNGRIGQSNLRLAGGYIDRDLPAGLLFTGEGSRNSWISFFIENTFQTLQPYEFLSDKYAHLFYSHNFGTILLKTKYCAPEWVVAYNAGWGDLANSGNHALDFELQNKIYQEGGLIIKNLVKIPILNSISFNMGFGGFYRFGYYHLPGWKDNLALKMAFSLTF